MFFVVIQLHDRQPPKILAYHNGNPVEAANPTVLQRMLSQFFARLLRLFIAFERRWFDLLSETSPLHMNMAVAAGVGGTFLAILVPALAFFNALSSVSAALFSTRSSSPRGADSSQLVPLLTDDQVPWNEAGSWTYDT